jgi:hypothetical protein
LIEALGQKEMHVPQQPLNLKITVPGGVGTNMIPVGTL